MNVRLDFYRDSENAMLCGICAGIADRFDLNATGVRVLAVVALVFYTIPTALVYLTAALLLRDKPLRYRGRNGEQEFWRRGAEGR